MLIPPADSTEDRDVVRVAAERRDVVAHPFEGGDLVEHPVVAGATGVGEVLVEVEEAEGVQSVVDGHEHHAVAGERFAGKSGVEPLPVENPPPWIQTIVGRFASSAAGVHTLRYRQSSPVGAGARARRSPAPRSGIASGPPTETGIDAVP